MIADTAAPTPPLRVAIVGAGPAGFFTADALLKKQDLHCAIDIFDRLPTPFGLVRDGVAPDHPEIKRVTSKFEQVFDHPSTRFFGNVTFGRDVTREDLRTLYDQVVYTVGASSDRRLGIPGEGLAGSYSATEFVAWYNGHPDYGDRTFDLSTQRAVVAGNGNVAVDVARILLRSTDELAETDIADHALEALRASRVREVVMLGRRGPAQAKFTNVELKELGSLNGVDMIVDRADLDLDADSEAALADDRTARRNYDFLKEVSERPRTDAERRLVLRFLVSPVEIRGPNAVQAVRTERNRLVTQADGYQRCEGVGAYDEMKAGLLLRSVGYRGAPLPDVPFDERRGVIPNEVGRVLDGPNGRPIPGEYVAGWIKRGPTGIIGTNKKDAAETVSSMVADTETVPRVAADGSGAAPIEPILAGRDTRFVRLEDWRRLDAAECARGEPQNRPRVKFVTVEDMLEAITAG